LATSSQPSPAARRCERPGNSTKSVTASDFSYFLNVPRAELGGTMWSCSPTVISSGARSDLRKSIVAGECQWKLARPSWKKIRPVSGTA
jgi:hypothetical protein